MERRMRKVDLALSIVASLAIIILLTSSYIQFGTIGYNEGADGLDIKFNSVNWKGQYWSTTEKGTSPWGGQLPSSRSFGYSMDLDPDDSSWGMPDLAAEAGAFVLLNNGQPVDSQFDNFTTILPDGTRNVTYVTYDKYKFQWNMSFWLYGTAAESWGNEPSLTGTVSPNWGGSQIWLKMDAQKFIKYYYDNGTEAVNEDFLISPALFQSQEVRLYAVDKNGNPAQPTEDLMNQNDWSPKSPGVSTGFYYERGGNEVDLSDNQILMYKGTGLNPAFFRTTYWTKINLVNFLPDANWAMPPLNLYLQDYSFPSVFISFTGYVWAVGKWQFFFTPADVVNYSGHPVPVVIKTNAFDLFSWIEDLFSSSWGWVIILAAAAFAAFFIFTRSSKSGSSKEDSKKYYGLKLTDWSIIGILVLLGVIPDPTDVLDFGLPILEFLGAGAWFLFRRSKSS